MIAYSHDTPQRSEAAEKRIRLFGIGGAGSTVIDRLVLDGLQRAALFAIDTDLQNLAGALAQEKMQIGRETTRGLGAGGDPEVGYSAAEAAGEELAATIGDAEVVFLIAGLGGGTGSGVAPVLARAAQAAGALVFTVATLPFEFEGRRRCHQAAQTLELIEQFSDAVLCFENDRMGDAILPKAGIAEAFAAADATLSQAVRSMIDLIRKPGLIHIGIEHLLSLFRGSGPRALFGFGLSDSDNRCNDALARALRSPLLDKGRMLADARRVLVHICGGPSLTLIEVQTIMEEAGRHIHDQTQIFFGTAVDPDYGPRLSVAILSSVGDPPDPLPELHPMRRALAANPPPTPPPTADAPAAAPQPREIREVTEPVGLFEEPPSLLVSTASPAEPEPEPASPPVDSHRENAPRQEVLQFEPVNRGRFEKSEPTIVDGEDLDVPTFMRKKIRL